MPRAIRERPRRTGVATIAVIMVLAVGWVAGVGVAGSTPRPRIATVVSTATETVTQTVTVAARRPPTRAVQARHRRMGRTRRSKRHSNR